MENHDESLIALLHIKSTMIDVRHLIFTVNQLHTRKSIGITIFD